MTAHRRIVTKAEHQAEIGRRIRLHRLWSIGAIDEQLSFDTEAQDPINASRPATETGRDQTRKTDHAEQYHNPRTD